MANDTGLTQLHPGIFTTIDSDQTVYETTSGVVTLFQADVFEKGPDSKIGFVSTKDEFIFKYGEPNYAKYGQASYNIINWLEAGGQAYIMRILPDDATFAHAILNVQTKVNANAKSILSNSGTIVKLDDVSIRPTTAFIQKNNLDLNMLETELIKDRSSENTVDGYSNNFILLVYPEGRGESYNNLGFRISLNQSFDNAYTSRVYNFEVVRYDSNANASVVEGPFYVTFDPDTLSDTRNSMYIEDVINRQSKFLRVKFNPEAFNTIAESINEDVNPSILDILTGTSRINLDGNSESFFSSVTGKNQDVHVALHRYNSIGEQITKNGQPVLNVPNKNDNVQEALINLDNGLRENSYIITNNKLAYMKAQFPKLRTSGFTDFKLYLDELIKTEVGVTTGIIKDIITNSFDDTIPTSIYSKFVDASTTYLADKSEENFNTFTLYVNELATVIRSSYLDNANKISAAYTLTEHNSPSASVSAEFALHLSQILGYLNIKDQINIFAVEHESEIYEIQTDIMAYQLGTSSGDDLENIALIMNNVEEEIKYVYENLLPVAYGSLEAAPTLITNQFIDSAEGSITNEYNSAILLLDDIQKGLMLNNAINRDEIFASANLICESLLEIIKEVTFTASKNNIELAVTKCELDMFNDLKVFESSIETMITPSGVYTEEAIRDNAREKIEIEESTVSSNSSKFFNTSLVDYSSPVKLLLGSDGSFEYKSVLNNPARTESIKRQLIKAYSGALNTSVLDTDLYRFNVILDARYDSDVKLAISDLARNSRRDFLFFADTVTSEYPVSPEDVLEWKRSEFNVSSEYVPIFSQDLTYYDEYTGKDIRFTPTYNLSSKIPRLAIERGLHYTLAGPRRGLIEGHKALSWSPNSAYREKLYTSKINYIQQDTRSTRFNSQLTSINSTGPLSYINNMFTILSIKREYEDLLTSYQFEFSDDETVDSLYTELNNAASKYLSNRSCETISVEVSRSDYDKQQRIIRVNVSIKFNDIIERIVLNLSAKK